MTELLTREEIKEMRLDLDMYGNSGGSVFAPRWNLYRIVKTLEHFQAMNIPKEKNQPPVVDQIHSRIADLKHMIVAFIQQEKTIKQQWIDDLEILLKWKRENND